MHFIGLTVLLAALLVPGAAPAPTAAGTCSVESSDPEPPAYYEIDLVTTKKVPGSRQATGTGQLTFVDSPFGISVSAEGHYVYELSIAIEKLRPPQEGVFVAWVTTPNIDHIRRIGVLDEANTVSGRVAWNKFLVVITLEPSADTPGDRWAGPIVLRGMSRSGLMHTMAGHGPFQQEPCAVYGY